MTVKQDPRKPYLMSEHDDELLKICSQEGLTIEEYGAFSLIIPQRQESD